MARSKTHSLNSIHARLTHARTHHHHHHNAAAAAVAVLTAQLADVLVRN